MDRINSGNGQAIIQLIEKHTESVRKRTITCTATVCRHCGLTINDHDTSFAFHGTRARRFLVLVDLYVCRIAALLARWRCPRCRRTFTDYPPFARPHKAYTVPQMTERAAKYVTTSATSYRKGVRWANLPIFYAQGGSRKSAEHDPADEEQLLPAMSHSSLFRWVTNLGQDAHREFDSLPVHLTPAAHKYMSDQRRAILMACQAACPTLVSTPQSTAFRV